MHSDFFIKETFFNKNVVVVRQGAANNSTPGTERRYNIYPAGASPRVAGGPTGARGTTHLHRNVAAFGEITVMPVGGETSDNDVRVAVDEELF